MVIVCFYFSPGKKMNKTPSLFKDLIICTYNVNHFRKKFFKD